MSKQLCPGLDPYERETVVNASDGDELTRILTYQRRYITKLRRHPRAVEVGTGFHGTSEWAEFTVPADCWDPVAGIKRKARSLSKKQLEALAAGRGAPGVGG